MVNQPVRTYFNHGMVQNTVMIILVCLTVSISGTTWTNELCMMPEAMARSYCGVAMHYVWCMKSHFHVLGPVGHVQIKLITSHKFQTYSLLGAIINKAIGDSRLLLGHNFCHCILRQSQTVWHQGNWGPSWPKFSEVVDPGSLDGHEPWIMTCLC